MENKKKIQREKKKRKEEGVREARTDNTIDAAAQPRAKSDLPFRELDVSVSFSLSAVKGAWYTNLSSYYTGASTRN